MTYRVTTAYNIIHCVCIIIPIVDPMYREQSVDHLTVKVADYMSECYCYNDYTHYIECHVISCTLITLSAMLLVVHSLH